MLTEIETISGALAAYDFTAIPATFRSLLLTFQGRSDTAGAVESMLCEFNGDTTAGSYNNAGLSKLSYLNAANQFLVGIVGNGSSGGRSGTYTMWLHNYADGSALHRMIELMGSEWRTTGANEQPMNMAMRRANVAAINRIQLTCLTGSFTAASGATLWGLGAA